MICCYFFVTQCALYQCPIAGNSRHLYDFCTSMLNILQIGLCIYIDQLFNTAVIARPSDITTTTTNSKQTPHINPPKARHDLHSRSENQSRLSWELSSNSLQIFCLICIFYSHSYIEYHIVDIWMDIVITNVLKPKSRKTKILLHRSWLWIRILHPYFCQVSMYVGNLKTFVGDTLDYSIRVFGPVFGLRNLRYTKA